MPFERFAGRRFLMSLLVGGVVLSGCNNAGEGRVLGITATGKIDGLVFFDRNGNRVFDAADTVLSNLSVRLVSRGTRDTVARIRSGAAGTFSFSAIPIGSYVLSIDTTSLPGDSLRVTKSDTGAITIRPDDALSTRIAVSFPQLTIAETRAVAIGRKVFTTGVALNPRTLFGDTTVHLADPVYSIRLENVRTASVVTGDSVRVLGIRRTRDGQPSLNQVTVFTLATDAELPLHVTNSGTASSANAGVLDAAFLRVLNVTVIDTATVQGNRRLHVNDGSGLLEVRLDTIVGFRVPSTLAKDTVGAHLDIVGLLVPIGTGSWRLKPRAITDVTEH